MGAGKEADRGALGTRLIALLGLATCLTAILLLGQGLAVAKPVTYVQKSYVVSGSNEKRRLTVTCPKNLVPLGGGMAGSPSPSADGEGIYPHSYERLGVQRGYHSTVVLLTPSGGSPTPRTVTLQVACSQKQHRVTPPHQTVFVPAGETRTAVATCPGNRQLFGGGFQRTDFTARGGDYVTESRAVSSKSWSVTAHAFGAFGGEMTAIAYCWRSKRPLLTEVSGAVTVPPGKFATANTTPCPTGQLVFGGFSTSPGGPLFFTDGYFATTGSWTSSAYNAFGPAATLTAYGYCVSI
jgi:hypothetical protein